MSIRIIPALAVLAVSFSGPVSAQSLDGRYQGASSIAGGAGKCWGNAPADGIVSGGTVSVRFVTYDGTQANVSATLGKDGAFTAAHELKSGGTASYSGRVTAKHITATWKAPGCYGTLDLSR